MTDLPTPEDLAREIEGCEEEDGYCNRHPALRWPCNDSSVRYYAAHVRNIQQQAAVATLRDTVTAFCDDFDHLHEVRAIAHWIDARADGYEEAGQR